MRTYRYMCIELLSSPTGVEQQIHLAVKHVEHLPRGGDKVEQLNTC